MAATIAGPIPLREAALRSHRNMVAMFEYRAVEILTLTPRELYAYACHRLAARFVDGRIRSPAAAAFVCRAATDAAAKIASDTAAAVAAPSSSSSSAAAAEALAHCSTTRDSAAHEYLMKAFDQALDTMLPEFAAVLQESAAEAFSAPAAPLREPAHAIFAHSEIGRKRKNEDTFAIVDCCPQLLPAFDGSRRLQYIGLFDGHGGSQASDYSAVHLHHRISAAVAGNASLAAAV